MDLCYSGKWTRDEMYDRIIKPGGFVDLLGTSEATDVTAMIDQGNQYAKLVYNAFIYQIGKEIGAMAVGLNFDVDAILLGDGSLGRRCSPGPPGDEPIKTYTGDNVFHGFDYLKP